MPFSRENLRVSVRYAFAGLAICALVLAVTVYTWRRETDLNRRNIELLRTEIAAYRSVSDERGRQLRYLYDRERRREAREKVGGE